MIETALVFDDHGRIIQYHEPAGRTAGSIPDTRSLWDLCWKYRNQLGGVAHTHPWDGPASPSRIDISTFRALELGLGRLYLWPVVTFTEVGYYGWDVLTKQYVPLPSPSFEDTLMPAIEHLRELSRKSSAQLQDGVV